MMTKRSRRERVVRPGVAAWFVGPLLGAVLVALVGGVAEGQAARRAGSATVYPETSGSAEALIRTAASHAAQKQWDSAIELYQRVIDQHGEVLTAIKDVPGDPETPEGFALYVNVRDDAQRRLSKLPVEALRLYRGRVDGEARHWYERGRDRLDPDALRRVVDQFFCSSWGDEATELLADLAYQDGRFDEAIALYRRLLPDLEREAADGQVPGLRHPDPDVEPARILAKIALCRSIAGRPPTTEELGQFRERFPDAVGELAGRDGRYVEIVEQALEEDGLRLPEVSDARWPTFAGSPSRNKVAPGPAELGQRLWSLTLRTPLSASENLTASINNARSSLGLPQDEEPAFFPVLVEDELLLTDGGEVLSLPLDVREPDAPAPPRPNWRSGDVGGLNASGNTYGLDRHTLTVHGDRVYARIGHYGVNYQLRNTPNAPPTSILALKRDDRGSKLWERGADDVLDREAAGVPVNAGQVAFGGAPVADEEGVYVTLLKPGTQALTWVVKLDPESGRPLWSRFICAATSPAFDRPGGFRRRGAIFNPDLGHRLLALNGSTLFYQTDLGAVAAIDARSGRINWLATYPRSLPDGDSDEISERVGPNPALVHGELVIVAPNDADRVFAYHRDTGEVVWQADPGGRVDHLLGVAKGRLVATGNHVWTIDIQSGAVRSRWPEGRTLESGRGRGLLAGDEILWPTADRLYVLDQRTGRPASHRPPIELRRDYGVGGGNLVAGDGYLVIAEEERLVVFCANSRMIRRQRERIAAEPERASLYYRLARTAAAIGDHELALESLAQAEARAQSSDRVDGRRLLDAVRTERYKALLKLADREVENGTPAVAAERLAEAASAASNDTERLEAALKRSAALVESGKARAAVDLLQDLLADARLRAVMAKADDQRSVRADRLIIDRLKALIRSEGRSVYAPYDQAAEELLGLGLAAEGDPRALEEIIHTYPLSEAVPEALWGIASRAERAEDWAQAARTYARLLELVEATPERVSGLVGLARAYEALGLRGPAREALELAEALRAEVDEAGAEASWTSLDPELSDRLRLPSRDGLQAAWRPPVWGRTVRRWPEGFRPLATPFEGRQGTRRGPILLTDGEHLRAIRESDGRAAWSIALEEEPKWSGLVGGLVVIGTEQRLLGVDPERGAIVWRFSASPRRDPELGAPADPEGPSDGSRTIRRILVHGDRLYALVGDRSLLEIDPASGRPRWTYRTEAKELWPLVGLGLTRIVAQVRDPNAIVVLRAADGRPERVIPQEESVGPWRRVPHPVTLDRVALVSAPDRVELLDLSTGRTVWETRGERALPAQEVPLVLGDADRLLVLRDDELQRIDPEDGSTRWTAPIGRVRLDGRDRSSPLTVGQSAVYWVGPHGEAGLSLGAVDLETGDARWRVPIVGSANETWGLGLSGPCLVALKLAEGTTGTRVGASVHVTLIDRESGRLVQRLSSSEAGEARRVGIRPEGVSIAGTAGLYRLAEGAPPPTPVGDRRPNSP